VMLFKCWISFSLDNIIYFRPWSGSCYNIPKHFGLYLSEWVPEVIFFALPCPCGKQVLINIRMSRHWLIP
jgi:hypothetical protein